MKIISIDPSLVNTCLVAAEIKDGAVRIISSITIETEKGKNNQVRASSDTINRCREIHLQSKTFIQNFGPKLVVVETPSGSQNSSAMKSYGAVCYMIGTISPWPIEVTPIEVKKATVGKNTASKKEMIAWAFEKHPEAPWKLRNGFPLAKQEHMADAIAVIYAGMKTGDYERISNILER